MKISFSDDKEWKVLTNALSVFCASLNFVSASNSFSPQFSFRPSSEIEKGPENSIYLRYSSLPQETAHTENLTPFKKRLRCDTKVSSKFYL